MLGSIAETAKRPHDCESYMEGGRIWEWKERVKHQWRPQGKARFQGRHLQTLLAGAHPGCWAKTKLQR